MSITRPPTLVFEPLRESHLDEIMEIEVEAYPEPWTVGMFRDEIRSPRSYFRVAKVEGVIVGYCGFWMVLDEAHITSVTVSKAFRGQGYGREQLQHLLETAVTRGTRIATLEVRESNERARKLYEHAGFRAVGVRKGYYSKTNEDAIVMLKELN